MILLDCTENDVSVVTITIKKGDLMRIINAKKNLCALLLSIFFIQQSMIAMPPQELYFEPSQSYALVYFIFFCIGTAACTLIHKYCIQQPIISTMKNTPSQKIEQKNN